MNEDRTPLQSERIVAQIRSIRRSLRTTTVLLGAAVVSASLVSGPSSAAADIQTLKVKATETAKGAYVFEGLSATLKGGNIAIELTNAGKEEHDLAILRIEGLHSLTEVLKVVSSEGGPIPAWLHADGGVGGLGPGKVGRATVNLGAGTYMFICTMTNDKTKKAHAAGGMAKTITVTGTKAPALPSGATATITAKEYGFETKGLKAGKNVVEFAVAGKELHHFLLFPLMAGKTIEDAKAAFTSDKPPAGPPPVDFDRGQGSQVLEKSEGNILTEVNLSAGRWAMICFMNDRVGGPPHIMKGMITEVVIK